MKRNWTYFLLLYLILLTACQNTEEQGDIFFAPQELTPITTSERDLPTAVSIGVGDDLPVSRALVSKMLALALFTPSAIDTMEREISYNDTGITDWYDRYINAVTVHGIMSGSEGSFRPEDPLTLAQAQILLDQMDAENRIKIQLNEGTKDSPISYALWSELYQKLLEGLAGSEPLKESFGIEEKEIIVLATPDNNPNLPQWHMITDIGPMSYRGYAMGAYIDREIKVLLKEDEIICILSLENTAPLIRNAYVTASDPVSITIFCGGAERRYPWVNDQANMAGSICDIAISQNKVISIEFYTEKTSGVIKRSDSEMVELENSRHLALDENFKVYSTLDGAVRWKSLKDLTVGASLCEFYIKNGQACGAVILRTPVPDQIRVVLHTTGYSGLYHPEVKVTCNTGFSVTGPEETRTYAAGEILTLTPESNSLSDGARLSIEPLQEEGRLQVLSIQRAWEGNESPAYRGILEIEATDKGLLLVNELPLEQYLYAVVPSEMPSAYGLEAARVQAVTARSYAWNQYYENRFHEYGAHVDDSVTSQVYNNIPENQTAIQAVQETEGICLTWEGQVVSANFFSTSSGMTANAGEVWADAQKKFPTETQPWLRSVKQYQGADYGDLSQEENATAFFKALDVESFDSSSSWFRWNVTMTTQQITASIQNNLPTRYAAAPALIRTLQEDGAWRSRPVDRIGALKDIQIVGRGEGGNITTMKIIGAEAEILVQTEYNIRSLIRPVGYVNGVPVLLNRQDGSQVQDYSLMPSAFYVMEKQFDEDGQLISITFYGGGNGHGAGMSQNGVRGMIEAGYNFTEILTHYYPGTQATKMTS